MSTWRDSRSRAARHRDARVAQRRRRRVVDDLYDVARRAAPNARRCRHELLLISRVSPLRAQLLEVASLVRCTGEPDPECLIELHRLLADGCASPLLNPDVPAEALGQILDGARRTLRKQLADTRHVAPFRTSTPP
jgi:hypothetical protein